MIDRLWDLITSFKNYAGITEEAKNIHPHLLPSNLREINEIGTLKNSQKIV